jgi:hypothetical protein
MLDRLATRQGEGAEDQDRSQNDLRILIFPLVITQGTLP